MKREPVLLVVALIALCGSITAALATTQQRDFALRGYVDPVQDTNLPFRVPRLGVNADLTQYTPAELDAQFERMETANITWVRQFFFWDQIEPEKNRYQWEQWDNIVQTIDTHPNLRLVAVLMNTPTWARSDAALDDITSPPANPADFADFTKDFATRYGEIIDVYQIWDEPNLTAAWGGLEPRAADYAALLREAYAAIHGADTGATVMLAALAPTTETGPQNVSDILYLRDLYALGIQPYMDAVAAKPYGFDRPPSDRTVANETLNFSRIIALREEMVRNGDGTKPLWASSWGWNSLPADWSGQSSIWGSVSADQQQQYILEALNRADREWPWLGGMILYHWQPNAAPDDPVWGFAVLDQHNNPTPLWQTLTQYQTFASAENGLFQPMTPYTRYSGVWTFGKMGADIGWLNDSQFDLNFTGRDLALLLRQDDYVAYLYPTVDGAPANAVPRDASGNAYIVLTSGSQTPELALVPVAQNLPLTPHTLHVLADRGWDRWALAGFAVSSGNLAAPYNRQISAAWLTAFIAAIGVFVTSWRINWRGLFQPITRLLHSLNTTGQLILSAVTSIAILIGMLLTWSDSLPNLFRREPIQLLLALLTAGLIYIEPGLVLTIIAALFLFVLIYNRLDLGLMLTLFWSPFFLFPVQLYKFAFPLAEIIILITATAWILRLLADWGRSRQNPVSQIPTPPLTERLRHLTLLDWAILAWLGLGILSLTWARYRGFAVTELRTMMVEPVLFYVIFRTTVKDQRTRLRLVDTLLVAGFVVALVSLVMFARGEGIITAEDGARRLGGIYGSPNNVGLFLGRCIPFALAFILLPVDRRRRLLACAIFGVMALTVFLSQSVGALFIGIPMAITLVLLLAWGKRARPILALAAILAVVTAIFLLQSARFAHILDFTSGTNFYRLRVWQSALNVIHDYPLTGLGLDQFLYAFRGHYILPDAWQEPNLSHPHNFILDFWVRLGLLGLVVFAGLQAAFWRQARRRYTAYKNGNVILFAIIVGLIGSMGNLLAHGLIDNSVYVQDLSYVFVFLLALAQDNTNVRAIDEPP